MGGESLSGALNKFRLQKLGLDEARQWRGFQADQRGNKDVRDESCLNDSLIVATGDDAMCDVSSLLSACQHNEDGQSNNLI